jgi:hypothetical protein
MDSQLERFINISFVDAQGRAIVVDQRSDMEFLIDCADTKDPDKAEVTLYNLKDSTISRLRTEALTIDICAGWRENPGRIFHGEIYDAVPGRSDDQKDIVVTVYAEDTKSKLRTSIIARTYNAGSPLATALKDLGAAAEMQVDTGSLNVSLLKAACLLGPPRTLINELCRDYGLRMQVVSGRLYVMPASVILRTATIPLISKDSGMIGSPTSALVETSGKAKRKQITVRHKLDSAFVVGGACELITTATGSRKAPMMPRAQYQMKRVTHTANRTTFETSMVLEEIIT